MQKQLSGLKDISGRPFSIIIEIGLLILLSFIWGNSFVLMKVAVETIPPLTLTAFRVTLAALLLLAVTKVRHLAMPRCRAAWSFLAIQGVLQCALPYTLISWGEKEISSGLAGVLNATPPVFVLLISLVTGMGGRIATPGKITGTLIGLAGVIIIMGFASLNEAGLATPLAQAAVLGASFCYALSPLIVMKYTGIPPLVTTTGSMLCASVMMLPVSLAVDKPWALTPSAAGIISAVTLAILCTAVAMLIYFRLVSTLGALVTASGGYLRAGFSVISGILFLGESITVSVGAGMLLIISGIAIVSAPPRQAAKTE